ncbi:MAG: hypothetical protein IPM29_00610 [Planctomycetes bacterium]|nr:hypothetical protein [Planctomycetota bacterium]
MTARELVAGVLVLGPLASGATQQPAEVVHVGPLTAAVWQGGAAPLWSVSQLGVCAEPGRGEGPLRCVWRAAPGERAVDVSLGGAGDGLLVAGGQPGVAGFVAWLDEDGAERARRTIADDLALAVRALPGTRSALVGCADGRVLAVTADGSEPRAIARHGDACRAIAVDARGELAVSGGRDGLLLVTSLAVPQREPLQITDHTGPIESIDFASDGVAFASGSRDGRVRVHDRAGRLLRSFPPLGDGVLVVRAVPGGVALDASRAWWVGLADGRVALLVERGAGEVRTVERRDTAVCALVVGRDRDGAPTVRLPRRR